MSESPTRPLSQKLRRFLAPALLAGLFLLIVTTFGHVLIPFVLALVIVYLIEPVVKRIHRVRIMGRVQLPRWSAVIIVYVAFFGVVSVFSLLVVPPLAREFSRLASDAPRFFEELRTETIPDLNEDLQGLIGRLLPTKLEQHHVREASNAVHHAVSEAGSMAAIMAAMTPEERELFLLGGTELFIEDAQLADGEPVAFRIRSDPVTGEWLVLIEDLEMVANPGHEGGYVLRARGDQQRNGSSSGPRFDLEESFNETLVGLVERSDEGVAELIVVGQGLALGLVGAFVSLILTFMIAAFISIDLPGIMAFFRDTMPQAARDTYDDLLKQLDRGLAGVVRGQLLICVINGTLTAIGLLLFNVKFALILALFAAILSLIPIFGTIISTIPAVGMALTQGISVALLVLGWILMIHFIEANILNPKIIGTSAHIHPVIVVFALLAGEHTYGLIGALLAVPVASVFLTLFKFVLLRSMEPPPTSPEGAT